MKKITLLAITEDGLENIEMERLHAYLQTIGYSPNCVHLDIKQRLDEKYSYIDSDSSLYILFVHSESSVYPEEILDMARLSDMLKKENPNCIIIFSGKYSSIYYKEIIKDKRFDNIDLITLGDAEYTVSEILDCMECSNDMDKLIVTHENIASKGNIDNKKYLNIDINSLPLPTRFYHNGDLNGNYYVFISESQGCCMRCNFCTRGQLYMKWTGRSAEDIFNEIKNICVKSKKRCFWFTGGSFEDPGGKIGIQKIIDFCNMVLESGLKISMRCYLRSNFVVNSSLELLCLMKKAGFNVVLVGVEAGNEFDLKLYNKGTTVINNKIALKKLKQVGIYAEHFGFIMINPYSTPERLKENYLFLLEHQPHDLDNYVHHLVIDSGTEIKKKVQRDGLLIKQNDFLKQGSSYKFCHPFAAEVSKFLNKNFLIEDTETAGISTFIYMLAPFIECGSIFEQEVSDLMKERAKVFSDYFGIIYLEMNIDKAQEKYSSFKQILKGFDIKLDSLKNRMIKELIKNDIM